MTGLAGNDGAIAAAAAGSFRNFRRLAWFVDAGFESFSMVLVSRSRGLGLQPIC